MSDLARPCDIEIIKAVTDCQMMPTAYYRNILKVKYKGLTTAFIRNRLKALEKEQFVESYHGSYKTIWCWRLS